MMYTVQWHKPWGYRSGAYCRRSGSPPWSGHLPATDPDCLAMSDRILLMHLGGSGNQKLMKSRNHVLYWKLYLIRLQQRKHQLESSRHTVGEGGARIKQVTMVTFVNQLLKVSLPYTLREQCIRPTIAWSPFDKIDHLASQSEDHSQNLQELRQGWRERGREMWTFHSIYSVLLSFTLLHRTCVCSEADVTSPVTRVNKVHKRVDVCTTNSAADNGTGMYNWTFLGKERGMEGGMGGSNILHKRRINHSDYVLGIPGESCSYTDRTSPY